MWQHSQSERKAGTAFSLYRFRRSASKIVLELHRSAKLKNPTCATC